MCDKEKELLSDDDIDQMTNEEMDETIENLLKDIGDLGLFRTLE